MLANVMQLRTALKTGLGKLLAHHVPSAQLAAELLMMHALDRDRAYLHAHPEEELSADTLSRFFSFVDERAAGKPAQYITGHQEFWGMDFEITPDVLIPRPETEHVVETIIELVHRRGFDKNARLRIVDVGTGSGCIALALAKEFPQATIFGADISRPALVVASRNALRFDMAERVKFIESDLLARLLDSDFEGTFDFVVSNPPYVGSADVENVQIEVREYEPRLAWGGLEQGDEIYRRLFPQALRALKPGGHVVVEIGYNLRDAVTDLLDANWTAVQIIPDLAGIPRVVAAQKWF